MENIKSFDRFLTGMNESITGKDIDSITRLKIKYPKGFEIPIDIKSEGKNSFANGIDTINETNPKIVEIVQVISDFLNGTEKGDINVVIDGGASDVGTASGYDNTKLAERRRDNLINYLKRKFTGETRLKITKGIAKVGEANKKDSVEAQKEQFVRAKITGTKSMNVEVKGVIGDNTNIYRPDIYKTNIKKKNIFENEKFKRVCVKVPENLLDKFKIKLNQFKTENNLDRVDYSVKDYS